jgi:photosystem II stability/assembly factor-like uncharacterized protein
MLGLHGDTVLALRFDGPLLYAGTQRGVHVRDLSRHDAPWRAAGLADRKVHDLLVLGRDRLLAAVAISGTGADTISLHLSLDGGRSWRPYQRGFGAGEGSNGVHALAQVQGRIFASGKGMAVARSTDGGASGDQAHHVVAIDPHDPQRIFTGTEGLVLRSEDGGESWETVLSNHLYFTAVHVSAEVPARVFAGGHLLVGDSGLHRPG